MQEIADLFLASHTVSDECQSTVAEYTLVSPKCFITIVFFFYIVHQVFLFQILLRVRSDKIFGKLFNFWLASHLVC